MPEAMAFSAMLFPTAEAVACLFSKASMAWSLDEAATKVLPQLSSMIDLPVQPRVESKVYVIF